MAHTTINGKYYVDTAFLNSLGGIPGVSLEHMGWGEFYAKTPHGRVEFDSMRGVAIPNQSGRSYRVYDKDDFSSPATQWLFAQMESRGQSVRVAASTEDNLRKRIIRLAYTRPDLREHLIPLVEE